MKVPIPPAACYLVLVLFLSALLMPTLSLAAANIRVAQFAAPDYDVVYVRCPRAKEPVIIAGKEMFNWNGVNDIWLSASNNVYHQPGCDLVLHHSSPSYSLDGIVLPLGDPGREEVLVNCNEDDEANPICTIADPNVSFDGKKIVYTKFTDTRTFIADIGMKGDGGKIEGTEYTQSTVKKLDNGVITRGGGIRGYDAPALIFEYDLETKTERQVSPAPKFFAGRAHPRRDIEWGSNIPVMDTGPFYMSDGRIGFTSNRENGFYKSQLFAMDNDGRNLELLGHRAMAQQLHPFILMDGRIVYTSQDTMLGKSANNEYSLFTINPDGSDPFIFAGKFDATMFSYHYATQLSGGDIVVAQYYNRNNGGMGSLLRFPVDPPGADFTHLGVKEELSWQMGVTMLPFSRVNQFYLTPQATRDDAPQQKYKDAADYWLHPSRTETGKMISDGGVTAYTDKALIQMTGRYTHPAAASDNDLLVTYTIGASSSMDTYSGPLQDQLDKIGKDAGVWLLPLEPGNEPTGNRQIGHIVDDAQIVVDFPEYHEIMPRALVPYEKIYRIRKPGIDPETGFETKFVKKTVNTGNSDSRLIKGEPFGLSGAATLYDRETRSLNGTPWNAFDGGGASSGRNYSNLTTDGAELAIFDNDEIYGIRVLLPITPFQNGYYGGIEKWVGQKHHTRILGEFPVRKYNAEGIQPIDEQGNPDTSFVLKIPANTPFLFQSLDKRGMALDIETTSRTVVAGEQQFCGGCHVHTRESIDPFASLAKLDTSAPFGDFSGNSAPLLTENAAGEIVSTPAIAIYDEALVPGVTKRRSFAVDWRNGISQIIDKRCAACHEEGAPAQVKTGLRLDGKAQTYWLLATNRYTREDQVIIDYNTLPGDGLEDVKADTPGTDRITKPYSCCRASRWVSRLSARSSMLVWAMYGERLDGRNPETGMPWGSQGEVVPASVPLSMQNLPVDGINLDNPEVWPKVNEHLSYLDGSSTMVGTTIMPEKEKRLIARWIDMGAPRLNVHDDMIRPVLTVTPLLEAGSISRILLGVWDDSPLDYSRFEVKRNGNVIMSGSEIDGTPSVIEVTLPVAITPLNADTEEYSFEIWDKPDRSLSLVAPTVAAANRERKVFTGRGLLNLANAAPNSAPTLAEAEVEVEKDAKVSFFPTVVDPDAGNTHFYEVVTQPANGTASVENNRLVYLPNSGYLGVDSFTFRATDLGGLFVEGTATITVVEKINKAPMLQALSLAGYQNQVLSGTPIVLDPDVGDVFTLTITSQPDNGVAKITGNNVEYTPNVDFSGADAFIIQATDSGGLSDSALVSVQVGLLPELGSENVAPSNVSARLRAYTGQVVTVSVSFLDDNIDDTHTISIVSQPVNGYASVANGQLSYVSVAGFTGSDDFDFRVTDTGGLWAEGTASVEVIPRAAESESESQPDSGSQSDLQPNSQSAQVPGERPAAASGLDGTVDNASSVLKNNNGELGRKAAFLGALTLNEVFWLVCMMLLIRYYSVHCVRV